MALSIGDEVVVASFGNKRGVIVEAGRDGHYRVRIENVTVSCREDDLTQPPAPSSRKRSRATPQRATPIDDGPAVAVRIDLHGLTVEEALARVVDEIDQALRRGADRLEIVHGKGSGRIRAALHRHLATMPVVRSVKLDARNPGVTWAYF